MFGKVHSFSLGMPVSLQAHRNEKKYGGRAETLSKNIGQVG